MKAYIEYDGKTDTYKLMVQSGENDFVEAASAKVQIVNGIRMIPSKFVSTLIEAVRNGCEFVY